MASHDLDVARGALGMFRQLDHAHGAGSLVRHLAAYIDTELASLLARPASGSSVASARSRLAAEFLELRPDDQRERPASSVRCSRNRSRSP